MGNQVDTPIQENFDRWRSDWCLFAKEVLQVELDPDQEAILRSVQFNPRTSVMSGTARGKDFVAAVAAICFLYLTPVWDDKGRMVENTRVVMTAPTDRQIGNIMVPEVKRLFARAKFLPGRLTGYDIRTDDAEWYLTGFKADEHQHEAWSGLHAAHILFIVTESTGVADNIYNAIDGNLQGDSRELLVGNPNTVTGYAATAMKSPRWNCFRLDSLNAPNVLKKKIEIPGQVDYEWVKDKVETWCHIIPKSESLESEGDFEFEGFWYRPNDLFRVKVRGLFPKVSQDVLVPQYWVDLAKNRYKQHDGTKTANLRLGMDVAGMGRDSSCLCNRFGNYVEKFEKIQSGGVANHMHVVGIAVNILKANYHVKLDKYPQLFVDTVGEGGGSFSRLEELKRNDKILENVPMHSVKGGVPAKRGDHLLKDITGQYTFKNLRAYLYWAVRDWLNPDNETGAMLPPDYDYAGLTELKWNMRSDGSVELEEKKDLITRIGRSPDEEDSLMVTFYPVSDIAPKTNTVRKSTLSGFH